MFEKLENFIGFIFKMTKWILMLLFIVFVVILFRSCSQTMDVMENAKNDALQNKQTVSTKSDDVGVDNIEKNTFECDIEDWKFQKTSSQYITIDGTTTCNSGKLVLKVYDSDTSNYIGNDTTYIRNGIFKTLIRTPLNPNRIEIKFTIMKR